MKDVMLLRRTETEENGGISFSEFYLYEVNEMSENQDDVIEKIRKAGNIEEVKNILKKNKIELEDDEIMELYEEAKHFLSDDEVGEVSGGIRCAPPSESMMDYDRSREVSMRSRRLKYEDLLLHNSPLSKENND